MNPQKDTVFMSTQSLNSQQEDAAAPAVNKSLDEMEMEHSINAQETQDGQEHKEMKRKKMTPKHKVDSRGYALKKSNNDIKHLSSLGELNAAGEYFAQGCTPTNGTRAPVFNANPISAKVHPRKVKNMPKKPEDEGQE